MNLFDKLKEWVRVQPPARSEAHHMRAALDEGRRAKFDEDYPRALARFEEALHYAETQRDLAVAAVIALHRGDVFIRQGRWAEAETLLTEMLQEARRMNHHIHVAYVLCSLGELAQRRGSWSEARAHYEEALDVARTTRALGAEGRALGHLADTYLHDKNASYAEHLLRSALPKLNLSEDLEMNSYFAGLLGEALIQSGHDVEGQQWLKRALQLATHMNDRYYQRWWSLVLGQRAFAEARYDDARLHYERALELFPVDARTPEYVRALCGMSQTHQSIRDYETALKYAQVAVQLSETMDDMTSALAQGTFGIALRLTKQTAEAVPHLRAAVAVYAQLDSTERTTSQIDILRNLAASLVDTDPTAAVETYQKAIRWADQMGNHLQIAQTRRDLGLIYLKRRDYQAAIVEWTTAIPVYEESRQHAQIARLYTDISGARKQIGQHPRAMKDCEQALMVLNYVDEADYETRGLVLSNAANAYAEQGDVESADAFFNDSISFAEKIGDQSAESVRRGNYGWFLLMVGRPRRAIAMLEQALELSRKLDLKLQQAVQTDNLGLAYDYLGDYQLAQRYHREALALIEVLDAARWRAILQANLAETLLSLGQIDEAQTVLDAVLAQARALDDVEALIRAYSGAARLALLQRRPADAEPPLIEAINLARRTEQKRLLAEALSLRSEQHAALDQPDAAKTVWNEAQRLYSILHMPQAKTQPAWLRDDSQP